MEGKNIIKKIIVKYEEEKAKFSHLQLYSHHAMGFLFLFIC